MRVADALARDGDLLEEFLEVLAAAQAEGLEEVHEVQEGQLRGVRDGGGGFVARAAAQRHAAAVGAVAVGEAEGEGAGAEPRGGAAAGYVVEAGVAGVRLVNIRPHLQQIR